MSGRVADRKRLLHVTAGNLRHSHLYVSQHLDFFPPDIVGPAKLTGPLNGRAIRIHLDGLNETVETDIGSDPRTGRPRSNFRQRAWVRRFFEHYGLRAGDAVVLERAGQRDYRLLAQPVRRPKAAEFFAGIGLVRLALENQGWDVVFANDIDPKKAEMYRHNWPTNDHLVVGDIHNLTADDVPTVDLFTASFPCNDLSIAGRWNGLGVSGTAMSALLCAA